MHNKFIQNDIIQSYYIFIANIASFKRKKYGITKKKGEKKENLTSYSMKKQIDRNKIFFFFLGV